MHIEPDGGSDRNVLLVHDGVVLTWRCARNSQKPFDGAGPMDLWDHINSFWRKKGPVWQAQVFENYRKIWEIIQSPPEVSRLINRLQPPVAALLNLHNQEEMINHLFIDRGIIVPTSCSAMEYTPNEDRPGTREKTYVMLDYQYLAAMCVTLRTMIPVFGEMIQIIHDAVGAEFKEMWTAAILRQSELWTGSAMKKLEEYTQANLTEKAHTLEMSLTHIGKDQLLPWMVARLLVRRICVADVRGIDPGTSAVSYIYSFVTQQNNTPDDHGNVREKIFSSGGGDEENGGGSRVDEIRGREDILPGCILVLELEAENYRRVAERLMGPHVNLEEVDALVQHAQINAPAQFSSAQIRLAQWVLAGVVSSNAMDDIRRNYCLNLLALAQYWLYHHRFYWLSGFVTAKELRADQGHGQYTGEYSRHRVPKDMGAVLGNFYRGNLQGPTKGQKNNDAILAIGELADVILASEWELNTPAWMTERITGNSARRRIVAPADLQPTLGQMVLALNS